MPGGESLPPRGAVEGKAAKRTAHVVSTVTSAPPPVTTTAAGVTHASLNCVDASTAHDEFLHPARAALNAVKRPVTADTHATPDPTGDAAREETQTEGGCAVHGSNNDDNTHNDPHIHVIDDSDSDAAPARRRHAFAHKL